MNKNVHFDMYELLKIVIYSHASCLNNCTTVRFVFSDDRSEQSSHLCGQVLRHKAVLTAGSI